MTYFLSKALWAFFLPLNAIIILLISGLLFRRLGRGGKILRRLGGISIGLSATLMAILGFTNIPDYMLYTLENQAVAGKPPEKPAGILIIGGGLNNRITRFRGVNYALKNSSDRLIKGFELLNKYPDAALAYSGGMAKKSKYW